MKFLFLLFILFSFGSIEAQDDQEKIAWEDEVFLSWDDFKGKPDPASDFKANTNTGMIYSWGLRKANGKVSLKYEVHNHFYPQFSWVNPGSKVDHLLKHEQLHFDISELHARKLRKKLSEIDPEKLDANAKQLLNNLYSEIDKERSTMQKTFDRESNHSINKEQEAKWQKFVKGELLKYKDQ